MCTQIDAETIVPARITEKEEWGAYTLRPKILRVLDQYMGSFPDTWPRIKWKASLSDDINLADTEISAVVASLDVDEQVSPTPHFIGGLSEASERLSQFIEHGLPLYGKQRNDIGVPASSNLSPYLHFGQISPLEVALAVRESAVSDDCVDAFLEQLIVRRGLAINFCVFNDQYDSLDGAASWARESLERHRHDRREEVYSLQELESAQTHDDLWNAAQMELVKLGKIHPYMRMVWAKKMLEWCESPEDSLARTIYLNDKYALDGRDPNGYANIAWCIHGKHDRPFVTRNIYGKIRYMTTDATKRKTNWQDYIRRVEQL
jgi:deoxyribodipyrimidine photo-lyase